MKRLEKLFYPVSFVILLSVLASACKTSSKTNTTNFLTAHPWELIAINGKELDMSAFQKGTPFLKFEDDGRLSGSTGCNNFSGDFKLENKSLTLNPGAMTRMACQGNGEMLVLDALSMVKNIKTDADKLTLLDGSRELMTLIPKK